MDLQDEWDYARSFTIEQIALLMHGNNPRKWTSNKDELRASLMKYPVYRRLWQDVLAAEDLEKAGQHLPNNALVGEDTGRGTYIIERTTVVQWLASTGLKSVYEFDLGKEKGHQTEQQQSPEIDPLDYPEELDAANMAFRAVKNGYGDANQTFRNRLIAYLGEHYKNLVPEAVGRIATVANPDKTAGRKTKAKE